MYMDLVKNQPDAITSQVRKHVIEKGNIESGFWLTG